ncbi:MAG TPA: hypothetical protein VFX49_19725, partial [Chloroflexota bacterium]|nr:hypothetical protein [Chloroflexota bacterium]
MDTTSTPRRITSAVELELGDEARPILVRWTSRREGESAFGSGGHSYALRTASGVVLVDPYRIDGEVGGRIARLIDAMSEGSRPIAILCTDSWHERAAYDVRAARGIPIWLPRAGASEMDGQPDHLYDESTALPAGIRGTHLEDLLGNTALLARATTGESVLFAGDCILGGSGETGHWRETVGMNLWLTGRHERDAFARRFGRLLDLDVDLLCTAHGHPAVFRDGPLDLLRRALDAGQHRQMEYR